MAAASLSTLDAYLKELYTDEEIVKLWAESSPFYGMVTKADDFYGNYAVVPVQIGMSPGVSKLFANAQANQNSSAQKAFHVTRARQYSIVSVDNETIRAMSNDEGAFLDAIGSQVDAAMRSAERQITTGLFRNKGASIGRLGGSYTDVTGNSLTLATRSDIVNFEVGLKLGFSNTDGTTGTVRANVVTVAAVDRANGVITTVAATDSLGFKNNDYLFIDGDFNAGFAGLDSWIPSSVTSTSFFGVDRTVDSVRLGGVTYSNGSGGPIEQTLIQGVQELALQSPGARPDVILMNPLDFGALCVQLGSRTTIMQDKVSATGANISYDAIKLATSRGFLKVVPDINQPVGIAYVLQMNTWKFWTLGKVGFLPEDATGGKYKALRVYNADSVEIRIGCYGNLVCKAPGYNARITL